MKNRALLIVALLACLSLSLSGCFTAPEIDADFFAPEDPTLADTSQSQASTGGVDGEAATPADPAADDATGTEVNSDDPDGAEAATDTASAATDTASASTDTPEAEDDTDTSPPGPECGDEEVLCNGIDDDCDPDTLDDACPQPEELDRYAACAGSICKTNNCEDGTQNQDGLGTGDAPCEVTCIETADIQCDGVDQDCDGVADTDDLCADQGSDTRSVCAGEMGCQTEDCEPDFWDLDGLGSTGCEYECTKVGEGANDATCDGVDDDCDGEIDEDHEAEEVTCGQGVCAQAVTKACVEGALVACEDGDISTTDKTEDDSLCDGIDNDCDGETDEDHTPTSITCGEGACEASGTASCVAGALFESCIAGTPDADDPSCDGVDNDCDSVTDEDFVGIETSCGDGACQQTFTPQCEGGMVTECVAMIATVTADDTCDGVDDDCDGETDEDASCERHCMESAGDESTMTVCREYRTQTYDEAAQVEVKITSDDDQTCLSGTLFDGRCPLVVGEVAEDGADTTMAQATGCEITAGEEYRWFYAQTDSHTANHAVIAADVVEGYCAANNHKLARQCAPFACDGTTDPDCLELCLDPHGKTCTELVCSDEPKDGDLTACETRSNDDLCTPAFSCQTGDCDEDNEDGAPDTGCVYTADDTRCDDGEDCAIETCEPGVVGADGITGCLVTPELQGTECTDRDLCTTGDTCNAEGECEGTLNTCAAFDTGATCRVPLCFAGNCLMVNVNDGTSCEHPEPCAYDSSCQAGECVPAVMVPCDEGCQPPTTQGGYPTCPGIGSVTPDCTQDSDCYDGYPCTIDICDTSGGGLPQCDYTWRNDAAACSFETSACCTGGVNAGCPELKAVEHCVCEMQGMSQCCGDEGAWSEECVVAAEMHCGLSCDPGPIGECGDGICDTNEDMMSCPDDCAMVMSPCCTAQPEWIAGCAADSDIEDCVCDGDPYCCGTHWDISCAETAIGWCGLSCMDTGYCGDGDCGPGEDFGSCPQDCDDDLIGDCGNGLCDPGDDDMCPEECGPPGSNCGDGICSLGEDPSSCDVDCLNSCGDDVCGFDEEMDSGDHCVIDCGYCGDGVCDPGEGPGAPTGCQVDCDDDGGSCNYDGDCQASETVESCPSDCTSGPGSCGDSACNAGETPTTCPWDCIPASDCDFNNACDQGQESAACPDCWDEGVCPGCYDAQLTTCEDPVCDPLWDGYNGCAEQCDDVGVLPICTHDSECSKDAACWAYRCVLDAEEAGFLCQDEALETGTACSDGDTCTENDMCSAGDCFGDPVDTPYCSAASCDTLTFGALVDGPGLANLDVAVAFSNAQPDRGFVFSLQGRGLKTYDFESGSEEAGKPSPSAIEDVSFGGYAGAFELSAVDMSLNMQNEALTAYVVDPDVGMQQLYVDSGIHVVNEFGEAHGAAPGAYLVSARNKDGAVAVATQAVIHILAPPAGGPQEGGSSGLPFVETDALDWDSNAAPLTKLMWGHAGLYALHRDEGLFFMSLSEGAGGFPFEAGGTKKEGDTPGPESQGLVSLWVEGLAQGLDFIDVVIVKDDIYLLIHSDTDGYRIIHAQQAGGNALTMAGNHPLETEGDVLAITRHSCGFLAYATANEVGVFSPQALQGESEVEVMSLPYSISGISTIDEDCAFDEVHEAWFAVGGEMGGAALIGAVVNAEGAVTLKLAGSRCRVGPAADIEVTTGSTGHNLAYVNDTGGIWKIDGPDDMGQAWHQLRILDLSGPTPTLKGKCTIDGTIADLAVSNKDFAYLAVTAAEDAEEGAPHTLLTLSPGQIDCASMTETPLQPGLSPSVIVSDQALLLVGGEGAHPLQAWSVEVAGSPKLVGAFPQEALDGMQSVDHIVVNGAEVFLAGTGADDEPDVTRLMRDELVEGVLTTVSPITMPALPATGLAEPLYAMTAAEDGTVYALQGPSTWEETDVSQFVLIRVAPSTTGPPVDPESTPITAYNSSLTMPTDLLMLNDTLLIVDPNYGVLALSHSLNEANTVLHEAPSNEAPYAVAAKGGHLYIAAGDSLMQTIEIGCEE
ncbi:MAG: hypothetical protein ACPGU1_03950 [Myxococcota bacterium]